MEFFTDYWDVFLQSDLRRFLMQHKWHFILPPAAILLICIACLNEQIRRFTPFKGFAASFSYMLLPALILIALTAFGSYNNNFGQWRYGSFMNAYEFYHYYIGSKYAPEVEYKNLYNATIVADAETGLKFGHSSGTIKNLDPKRLEVKDRKPEPRYLKPDYVISNKEKYKASFTPERWEEFVGDIKFFKKELVNSRWNGMLRDKGYNGSPAWSTVVGGLLSNNFSTDDRKNIIFLASLDLILILLGMGFVWWAFGLRSALLMLVLLGTSYVMSFSHMKGAYLRTDFVIPIVISICLVKKNHYGAAGLLMGYAAVARVFPAVFLFGLGARLVWNFLYHRKEYLPAANFKSKLADFHNNEYKNNLLKVLSFSLMILASTFSCIKKIILLNKSYIIYFACVVLMVTIMLIAPIAYTGSTDLWKAYSDKIADHADDISTWRVGFKYFFMADFRSLPQYEKNFEGITWYENPVQYADAFFHYWSVHVDRKFYEENQKLWYGILAAMLVFCLFASRGLKDHDALAFSFVPCFFLAAPTYYYYIMLLIPMLFFVPYMNRPGRALGAIALLAMAMPGYYLLGIWRTQNFNTYYWHSAMYFGLTMYMMALALADTIWAFWKKSVHAPYYDDREFSRLHNSDNSDENQESDDLAQSDDTQDEFSDLSGEQV